MGRYPEHAKLSARRDEHKAIVQFLQWLEASEKYRVHVEVKLDPDPDEPFENEEDRWWRVRHTGGVAEMIAEFFDVDPEVLEREREQMIEDARSGGDQK